MKVPLCLRPYLRPAWRLRHTTGDTGKRLRTLYAMVSKGCKHEGTAGDACGQVWGDHKGRPYEPSNWLIGTRGNERATPKLETSHETQCTWLGRVSGCHVSDPCRRASFLRHVRCAKVDDARGHRQGIPVDQSP